MAYGTPVEELQRRAKERGALVAVPCRDRESAKAFVRSNNLQKEYVRRMYDLTLARRECCWIACPLFALCDLHGWGLSQRDREECLDMYQDLLRDKDKIDVVFSGKELKFLWDTLERLESDESFSPSERQIGWLRNLHERYLSRKQNKRI